MNFIKNKKLKKQAGLEKNIKRRDVYYTKDRNAVGILKYDDGEVYLGIFNLSNKKKKIHWKFSKRDKKCIKGLGKDIFTETLFFINHGEIYIDSLMPNDCYIIKINEACS